MRQRRLVVSGLSTIGFALCLGLFGSGRAIASPVPADERSLANGAALYDVYCSECHGQDPDDRSGELYETDRADDYASDYYELPEIIQSDASTEVPARDDWPEWAERPDPSVEAEPDIRAEVFGLLTAQIDQARRVKPSSDGLESSGESSDGGTRIRFDPIPGVTDLSAPESYFYGTSEEEVFNSIAKGTGAGMHGWRDALGSEEDIWDVVNYIRNFWGEEWLY